MGEEGVVDSLIELASRIESAASGDNGEACWRHTQVRPPGLPTSCHHLPGHEYRGLGDLGFCYPIGSGEGFIWDEGYIHPWPEEAECPPG